MKTTSEYQIRRAKEWDANGILACLHVAFERYRAHYTPEGFADTVLDSETIKNRMREMVVLVAVCEDTVVGTIGCVVKGEEGHLRGMAVHPGWQGTAIASALLGAAEKELRRSKCTLVTLDTTEPLKRATRFYEKHGFCASGRISDFFGMPLYEYSKSLTDNHSVGRSLLEER